MITRRVLFEGTGAMAGAFLAQAQAQVQPAARPPVFLQDLPPVALDNWTVTAVEVIQEPGAASKPHSHPGFVLGYVLEGELRFQLKGQEERTYRTGEMFYEPPGAVHLVSASASKTKRTRFLALVFAEKGKTISMPA